MLLPDANWRNAINTMPYNRYSHSHRIRRSNEVFFGNIPGISDVIGFHGDGVAEDELKGCGPPHHCIYGVFR